MNGELFFNLANGTFMVGTLLLARTIIKNRDALRDFDVYGSGLTFIGMIFSGIAVAVNGIYLSLALLLPTLVFWGLAFYFSSKNKLHNNQQKP